VKCVRRNTNRVCELRIGAVRRGHANVLCMGLHTARCPLALRAVDRRNGKGFINVPNKAHQCTHSFPQNLLLKWEREDLGSSDINYSDIAE
jgi:hypothetical protein